MFRSIALLCLLLSAACIKNPEPPQAIDLIVTGGVVIHTDSDAPPIIEDIAIADGRIVAVGADLAKQYAAKQTYDASGRYIIPGLADMHSHFGNGILEGDADDTAQVLSRHLYFGNTTILNLGSAQGWPNRIDELRASMASGEIAGPRLLAVGALITVPGSHPVSTIYSQALQEQIADLLSRIRTSGAIDLSPIRATTLATSPENIASEVRRVGDWGADAIKITVESGPDDFGDNHPQMPPEMIRAASDAAKAYGIPVLCHISSLDEVEDCLNNGASGIVHAMTPEEALPDDIEQRLADAAFVIIPTASLFDGWRRYGDEPALLDRPVLAGVLSEYEHGWLAAPHMQEIFGGSPEWSASIDRMAQHLKKFHDFGGMIIAGTDTGNPYRIAGVALHEELAFYVEAVGLTPREALATATVNAARLVGDQNEWGALREG
ncbi:amidohydrolase family protein, partial [Hyphococcus sp.]|uniref:amidohydrolase family protein n=1 Tax=Hyphococcus sp. TaxID=2038636 RepID=UPI003751F126